MTELENILDRYEINRRILSEEVGRSDNWLSSAISVKAKPTTLQPVIFRLEARGHRLLRFRFSKHNLDKILDACGLKMSWLAKQMGISRQGLYKGLEEGLTDERRAQIEEVLHSAGQALIDVVSKLKK